MNQLYAGFGKVNITPAMGIALQIYLHVTHTHTAPTIEKNSNDERLCKNFQMVYRKMADVAQFALADLKSAKMGWGIGEAPNIA